MMGVPLAEALDPGRYGGKAVQLGRGLRAGLPVPPGWALESAAVERLAQGREAAALAELYASFKGASFAVRSSAVDEDSAQASFAGQHLTVLDVRSAEGFAEALRQVWLSARSASALAYRRKLGLKSEAPLAVVLQVQVPADCAGVLFTVNPLTQADERVAEGAWGLGESVVQGLVDPDRWRWDRQGQLLEEHIGDKDRGIFCGPQGPEERPLEPERAQAPCLDAKKRQGLLALAQACEEHWASKRLDLEWAFQGDGLYLLQCRPITR